MEIFYFGSVWPEIEYFSSWKWAQKFSWESAFLKSVFQAHCLLELWAPLTPMDYFHWKIMTPTIQCRHQWKNWTCNHTMEPGSFGKDVWCWSNGWEGRGRTIFLTREEKLSLMLIWDKIELFHSTKHSIFFQECQCFVLTEKVSEM